MTILTEGGEERTVATESLRRGNTGAPGHAMQRAFDSCVPSEQGCDWWKSSVEPWRSIAREAGL